MSPEQFEKFLKLNEHATSVAIEKFVNGKIDILGVKLDEHANSDKKYQEKIDGNITWVVRLIIGAVLLGVIAMIFKI